MIWRHLLLTFCVATAAAALAFVGAAAIASAAVAPGAKRGGLVIEHPWARETAVGQTAGGGFLIVTNRTNAEDRLIAANSPAAAKVEIPSMVLDSGVMKMRPVPGGLAVPAGGSLVLKPGSFHIMFIGLSKPFRRGDVVPAVLTFAKAGKVAVRFEVQPVTYGTGIGRP